MRYIALKHATNGSNYQISRFRSPMTDKVALLTLILGNVFFRGDNQKLTPKMIDGCGFVGGDTAYCFTLDKARELIANTDGAIMQVIDEPKTVNFKPLTELQLTYEGQEYEDGYPMLLEAIKNKNELAEQQGFKQATLKGDVISISAECSVVVSKPKWEIVTTHSTTPNDVYIGATGETLEQWHVRHSNEDYPSIQPVAPTHNKSLLGVYRQLNLGDRFRVMLGEGNDYYPFFKMTISRRLTNDHPAQAYGATHLVQAFRRPDAEMTEPRSSAQSSLEQQPSTPTRKNYWDVEYTELNKLYITDYNGARYLAKNFDGEIAIVSGRLDGGDEWQLAPIVIMPMPASASEPDTIPELPVQPDYVPVEPDGEPILPIMPDGASIIPIMPLG